MESKNPLRGAIFLVGAMSCLFWTLQNGYAMYLTPHMEVLGASSAITGFMLGAYGLPQILLRIPMGMITDRRGNYKQFIIIGNVCSMLAMLGMWLCQEPWMYIILRFLVGISGAVWACYGVVFGGYFSATGSMKSGEYLAAFTYIGQVVGNLACWGAYAIGQNYRASFFVMFVFSAISLVMSFFIKENDIVVDRPPITWKSVKMLLGRKRLWLAGLICLCMDFITYGIAHGFLSQFAMDLGASVNGVTVMALVSAVVCCFSAMVVTPFLRKRLGVKRTIILAVILLIAYCLCLPLCKDIIALILMRAVMSICHGIMVSSAIGISVDGVAYEHQATSISLLYSITSIGIMIGPMVAGAVTQLFDMETAFRVIGGVQVIGLICALLLPKDKEKKE